MARRPYPTTSRTSPDNCPDPYYLDLCAIKHYAENRIRIDTLCPIPSTTCLGLRIARLRNTSVSAPKFVLLLVLLLWPARAFRPKLVDDSRLPSSSLGSLWTHGSYPSLSLSLFLFSLSLSFFSFSLLPEPLLYLHLYSQTSR